MRFDSKQSFLAPFACVLLLACAASFAQVKPLTIGTDGAYPPYNSTTPAGTLVGFEIDLVNDLCKRMGRTCKFITVEWTGLIPKLQEGTVDVAMSAMSILPERRKVIDFTVPYFAAPTYFVAKKGSKVVYDEPPRVIDLDNPSPDDKAAMKRLAERLKAAVVGVEGSTTHEKLIKAYFSDAKRVTTYPKQESLHLDMTSGRLDTSVSGLVHVSRFIKEEKDKGREYVMFGPGMRGGVLGSGVAFGIRKGNDELVKAMDKAIMGAARDGTIRTLSQKWFGMDGTLQYGTPAK